MHGVQCLDTHVAFQKPIAWNAVVLGCDKRHSQHDENEGQDAKYSTHCPAHRHDIRKWRLKHRLDNAEVKCNVSSSRETIDTHDRRARHLQCVHGEKDTKLQNLEENVSEENRKVLMQSLPKHHNRDGDEQHMRSYQQIKPDETERKTHMLEYYRPRNVTSQAVALKR